MSGHLFAPRVARSLPTTRAVSELQVGDFILHYKGGIRAVGRVAEPPEFQPKPDEITEDAWEDSGRHVPGGVTRSWMSDLARRGCRRLADRGGWAVRPLERRPPGVHVPPNQWIRAPSRVPLRGDPRGAWRRARSRRRYQRGELVTDLPTIAAAIRAEGLRIDHRTLRRFHLAAQARGFVISRVSAAVGRRGWPRHTPERCAASSSSCLSPQTGTPTRTYSGI